jgi:hypothetical protein
VQSAGNALASTTVNGHNDDYVFNQAGDRKLGVRRNWGGAIVFFGIHNGSAGMNTTNTIDGNDTGREVQIALYDHDRWYQGCAWNASCSTVGTSCPQTMAFFGWNPVQGGNRCNHGSGYEDVTLGKGEITLRTRPMFWNPNWDRTDCQESCSSPATDKRPSDVELTQKVRFVRPDVVELSYKVTNLGAIDHKPAVHEFPTLYASFGKNGTPDLTPPQRLSRRTWQTAKEPSRDGHSGNPCMSDPNELSHRCPRGRSRYRSWDDGLDDVPRSAG